MKIAPKELSLLIISLFHTTKSIINSDHHESNPNANNTTTGPRVLLIGFGPSGMFFCHALETFRQKLQGNPYELSKLPIVSAFERSSTYGGVWRKREPSVNDTAMYEGLWANGAKELSEFYDYTYDEHFDCALPTYIQRGVILDYMTARVTRNCTNFFEKYVTFNTNVNMVTYDNTTQTFTAQIEHLETGHIETNTYDKVIWAAGVNTIPFIPRNVLQELGDFEGKIIHSSDVSTLKEDIKGKQILLIGGATSAEDLALTSIKLGVEKVHVTFRSENNGVATSKHWPYDKVQLYPAHIPTGVDDNNCIEIEEVDPITLRPYEDDDDVDDDEVKTICNIDTIIFCTGYKADFNMLHPSVHNSNDDINIYSGPTIQMSSEWKMQSNAISNIINDDTTPSKSIKYYDKHPNLYKYSISMDNPNMMYMIPNAISLDQLLWADVEAHQLLYYILNPDLLPSRQDMQQWLNDKICDTMNIPYLRSEMDTNYMAFLEKHEKNNKHLQATLQNDSELVRQVSDFHFRSLAEIMQTINYPVDIGNKFVDFDMHDRNVCGDSTSTNCSFRDLDEYNLSFIVSVHTGTKAVPFKKEWLELDDFADYSTLCHEDAKNITLLGQECVSCFALESLQRCLIG